MAGGISSISRLVPGLIEKGTQSTVNPIKAEKSEKENFTEMFTNMLNSVDGLQKDAGQIQEAFMNGEEVELHELMIKAEEAGVSMDLLLEVRNKLINAYNQIMQMPI